MEERSTNYAPINEHARRSDTAGRSTTNAPLDEHVRTDRDGRTIDELPDSTNTHADPTRKGD
jgi:hypothetical protein